MNDDGGSRGGSRNLSTSGGRDHSLSVSGRICGCRCLTGKLTKEWLFFILRDTVSHLKKAESYIDNIVFISKQINSVNDRVIEINQVIIDIELKFLSYRN